MAGLTCSAVMTALSDVVDGGVDAALGARIEAHVAACGHCARFGASFGALLDAMRQRLNPPPPVTAEVLARLRHAVAVER
ncbi:MAG: zf-HC2 domain-containing protein [Vicinamibacterales bacterium]